MTEADFKTRFPGTHACFRQGADEGLHLGMEIFISRHGEVLADLAMGESEPGRPMADNAIMLWLSSGKPVTALAIARLWEGGQLELDDPVARHVPEFAARGKEGVTIHHLLTHTGGFRSADLIPDELGWDETLNRICQAPLEPGWQPGKKAGYHPGSSWFVLGEIVQRLANQSVADFVREQIFQPLGIEEAWMGIPLPQLESLRPRLAPIYVTSQGKPEPHPFYNTEAGISACRPGSNIRGPIRSLGRLYEALLSAWIPSQAAWKKKLPSIEPVLGLETVRQFTSRRREGMLDHTFKYPLDWGYGFIINSQGNAAEPPPYGYSQYAAKGTFGHGGAQSSVGFADPEWGLAVAWAFNGMPGEAKHQSRVRCLNTAIYEDLGLRGATGRP